MKQRNFLQKRQGKGIRVLLMSFILVVGIGWGNLYGATRTASVSGNWNSTTTWGNSSAPDGNDDVYINAGVTVTVNANSWASSLTVNGTIILNGGNLTIKDGGSVTNNSGGTIIFNSTNVFGGGGTTGKNGIEINISSGSYLTTAHPFGFNNPTGSFQHTTIGKTQTYNEGANYTFNGTDQNTGSNLPPTVKNLTLSGSGTKTVTGNISVTSTLTVNSGVILNMEAYTLGATNIANSGTIRTQNISTTPIPSGKTWGGTVQYDAAGAQAVTTASYNNLNISNSGIKTISGTVTAAGVITVNGALTVAATGSLAGSMIINSTSTTSGSFINNGTFSGTVTYNRWMDNTNLDPDVETPSEATPGFSRWYITSAPVKVTSGFDANGSKIHIDNRPVSPNPPLYDFANYITSTNNWDYVSSLPGNLTPGKGYLISLNPGINNSNISFTGGINGDLIDLNAVPVVNDGWNALGNPYTSAIGAAAGTGTSAKNFLDENSGILKDNYSAIYVWNEPTNTTVLYDESQQYYRIIGNSGYTPMPTGVSELGDKSIQTGQGFLINVNSAAPVQTAKFLKGTTGMQFHKTDLTLKSAKVSWPGITLLAESDGQTRSTVVAYNEQMTTDLDVTYDAGLLSSSSFNVYTHLVEGTNPVDFAIQCLPDNQYRELSVPVGVDLPEGGELNFKASGVILPAGLYPVIEDKLLGSKTDLKTETDSYTVVLDKNTKGTGRFYLSVAGIGLGTTEIAAEKKFKASFINNRMVVWGAVEPGTKAILYDLTGRKVGEYPLEHLNRNEINIPGVSQRFYLLKIEGKNDSQVIKVVGE